MKGTVYIVHCIDTEGPLYQSPEVPFQMIRDMFGVEVEPTPENLRQLQNMEYDLPNIEEISKVVDPHRIKFMGDWEEIEHTLDRITKKSYRSKLPDSEGNGWKYSWFCMDHVGFTGENPRRRDAGYHKVFDRYYGMVKSQALGDIVQFHYHPLPFSGNFNDSGTAFWGSGNLNDILCHKIIDRNWFPVAFRPGFHTERPDSHWFLEQWIPFDYGNQSYENESGQPDMSNGRFGDWRGAPLYWHPYHPNYDDYRNIGGCHRWITRCLNMFMRARQLERHHVVSAFNEASESGGAILAFTGHDYKDIEYEIDRVRALIQDVSEEYPDVRFQYEDAVSAFQQYLNVKPEGAGLQCAVKHVGTEDRLEITSSRQIFGSQPYLAIKSKGGRYYWDNLDYVSANIWGYVFDHNTIKLNEVEAIGVAANSPSGVTEVVKPDIIF